MPAAVSEGVTLRPARLAVGNTYESAVTVGGSQDDAVVPLTPTPAAPGSDVATVVPRRRSELFARLFNVTVAFLAILVVAPAMAIVSLLIKLTSPGPILYKQTRIGVDRRWHNSRPDDRRKLDHGGKPFEIYKFRSMRVDAEADGKPVWAQKKDPRVTPIGGFLRKARLDELPQLYNVLRGDMNIVGPRPERPAFVAELRQSIPYYAARQRVRPGITGWAQINQAYDSCLDDVRAKVDLDLEYLKRQSLAMDLRIMTMTIPIMLLRRGQ
jgi:lipopolysaccharide/colanic/teichoic acid biosynthesis glycosyltransferase